MGAGTLVAGALPVRHVVHGRRSGVSSVAAAHECSGPAKSDA